jgi:hypothetical protein
MAFAPATVHASSTQLLLTAIAVVVELLLLMPKLKGDETLIEAGA